MNKTQAIQEFILKTMDKIYNFALKNNFKKEINRHLPKKQWTGNKWKILILQNEIPYSEKKPLDICLDSDNFSPEEKELIFSIKDGFIASFEILNYEDDLRIYNFVNEKEYTARFTSPEPLDLCKDKYFTSMLVKFRDNYYIFDPIQKTKDRTSALLFAKEILITDSLQLYRDNPEKEQQVKALLEEIYSEFNAIFGVEGFLFNPDDIFMINDLFINIIKDKSAENLEARQILMDIFSGKFKEEESVAENNEETSEKKEENKLDPACLFVLRDKGIYLARYYNILENIYERNDADSLTDMEKDILCSYFFENEQFDYPIEVIFNMYDETEDKENFLQTTRNIIYKISEDYEFENFPEINSASLSEILDNFKEDYDSKLTEFSIDTLQIVSKTIDELFKLKDEELQELAELAKSIEEKGENHPEIPDYKYVTKPGRNDLCYCGSGKKFKKCCLQYED